MDPVCRHVDVVFVGFGVVSDRAHARQSGHCRKPEPFYHCLKKQNVLFR